MVCVCVYEIFVALSGTRTVVNSTALVFPCQLLFHHFSICGHLPSGDEQWAHWRSQLHVAIITPHIQKLKEVKCLVTPVRFVCRWVREILVPLSSVIRMLGDPLAVLNCVNIRRVILDFICISYETSAQFSVLKHTYVKQFFAYLKGVRKTLRVVLCSAEVKLLRRLFWGVYATSFAGC